MADGPDRRDSFDTMWADLEPLGRRGDGGYDRFAWTRTDADLRAWFTAQAADRGLDVEQDRAGNLWAWWGDPDAAVRAGTPGVVVGSHLDSVPSGGAFDGPLGVVSALAAVDALRDRGPRPSRPVGVLVSADEEGARFGVACAGTRLLTGALDPDRARALRDADGTTLAEAYEVAGHDPDALGPDPRALARVGTFVELHVEQGRGLVHLDRAVGVSSAIWPHGRWRFDLPGRADHAGTTRLADRDDPVLRLAQVVLAARAVAEQHDALATVGKVDVRPNAVNAVASGATLWLDVRSESPAAVAAVVADVTRVAGVRPVCESATAATAFDVGLTARASALLGDAPVLSTGAGHDAGVLAAAGVPTTMLLVRNPTGVSHSPHEHADRDDCLLGVEALTTVLADLVRDDLVRDDLVRDGGPRHPGAAPAGGHP
ncbi:allantoate amidohydrolase [Aquipuribacter sp. MA13-6]|uniref:allantoate amidohydrolase n=1 Tax=unclassified Aquipuribacter TaxID=2635084 RepID=UPI003EED257B